MGIFTKIWTVFGVVVVASFMMLSIAFAGDTTIYLKDGSTINVKTNAKGSMITRFNKAGQVVSTRTNSAARREGHRKLVARLSKGAVRVVRHHG